MDNRLSFNKHVNNISQRAYFKLKSIYHYRYLLSHNIKKILTESLILSIPNYLDIVYGPFLTNYNKFKIQKLQNSCVRFIHDLSRRDHVSQHIAESFKCNMAQKRFIHLSCLIHKLLVLKEPSYLTDFISLRRDTHQVNIR